MKSAAAIRDSIGPYARSIFGAAIFRLRWLVAVFGPGFELIDLDTDESGG